MSDHGQQEVAAKMEKAADVARVLPSRQVVEQIIEEASDTPLTRSEGLLGLTPSYLLRALENYLRISQDT